jgi:DNA-binding NarL/FixJ family response regulator
MQSNSAASSTIRVYLVDDHPIVRAGLIAAIEREADLTVVGEAATVAEALAGAHAARPDVVLVDLALPDGDGPDLIARLRAQLPRARLMVVSGHDDEFRVAEALRAGAHGYVLKTSPIDQLVLGIREAAAGGTPISPSIVDGVVRAMRRSSSGGSGPIDLLTARELQVLRLFATGRSTREVALTLGISPKTVETHRARICTKLAAKSVVELTRIAMRAGLIQA